MGEWEGVVSVLVPLASKVETQQATRVAEDR